MANHLQLKQQFNSNKKYIKQVLNDQTYHSIDKKCGFTEKMLMRIEREYIYLNDLSNIDKVPIWGLFLWHICDSLVLTCN